MQCDGHNTESLRGWGASQGEMSHGPLRLSTTSSVCHKEMFGRTGQRIQIPSRKTTVHRASGVLLYLAKASTGLPSCTTHWKETCHITWFHWKEKQERHATKCTTPHWLLEHSIVVILALCSAFYIDFVTQKEVDKTDWWMWAAGDIRHKQNTRYT